MVYNYDIRTKPEVVPFVPTDIAGCKRWGRSDLGITKDEVDRVSIYADQSGNGKDFIQATDSKKFVFFANQIDGYPSLRADGIDDIMYANGLEQIFLGDDTPVTVFWVAKAISLATGEGTYWSVGQTGIIVDFMSTYWYDIPIKWFIRRRGDDTNIAQATGPTVDTNWHYFVMNFHGTTVSLRIDGVTVIDNAALDAYSFSVLDHFALGALYYNSTESQFGNIDFAEDGVYDSDISAGNIALLETYLHVRYPSI